MRTSFAKYIQNPKPQNATRRVAGMTRNNNRQTRPVQYVWPPGVMIRSRLVRVEHNIYRRADDYML